MGDGESGRPALSLEQCVAKALELTKLKQSDPTYKIMLRVWIDHARLVPHPWKNRRELDVFLRRPSSPAFSMLQRAWYRAFLKLHLAVAIERMKG